MPRSFDLYLLDMLQAGRRIQAFTQSKTIEDYVSDDMLRLAVERLFEILGEALSQSEKYYPERHPIFTAQHRIINFRHRVIHGYFDVNDEIVWSVTKVYLPPFLTAVLALLDEKQPGHPVQEGE